MSTSRSSSLAAFCSHGGEYKSFLSTRETIQADVEYLLELFGASEDVRRSVYDVLNSSVRFDEGFRYETKETKVYATLPISYVDDKKEFLDIHTKGSKSSEPVAGWAVPE